MTWARFMLTTLSRLAAVLGLALLCATSAQAQLEIEITRGMGARTPVAVVPFAWEGDTFDPPYDVPGMIAADLYRSGRFDPIVFFGGHVGKGAGQQGSTETVTDDVGVFLAGCLLDGPGCRRGQGGLVRGYGLSILLGAALLAAWFFVAAL